MNSFLTARQALEHLKRVDIVHFAQQELDAFLIPHSDQKFSRLFLPKNGLLLLCANTPDEQGHFYYSYECMPYPEKKYTLPDLLRECNYCWCDIFEQGGTEEGLRIEYLQELGPQEKRPPKTKLELEIGKLTADAIKALAQHQGISASKLVQRVLQDYFCADLK